MSPVSARLAVHVQPRARRTEVVGRHGEAIKLRLAAPPVDGAANEELIRFLSNQLGVPRSAVTIARGRSGRRKTVVIEGLTADAVTRALVGA